ncbi:unnamed protein product [Oikopleura dioica]|uniref:Uncharacterized protein n=1 Tax=Oikopleura dioica TaxID=34765 RepID=E4X6V8_OIKDI|nr:unnamed protein product [Oikopleura dioica]
MKVLETIPPNNEFTAKYPSPLYPQKVGRDAVHFSPELGCWFTLKIRESQRYFTLQAKFYETDHDPFKMNKPCRFKLKKRFLPVNIIVTKEKAFSSEFEHMAESVEELSRELLADVQFEDQFATVIVPMNNSYDLPLLLFGESREDRLWKNPQAHIVFYKIGEALATEAGLTKTLSANEYFQNKMMAAHLSRSFKKINLEECRCHDCTL